MDPQKDEISSSTRISPSNRDLSAETETKSEQSAKPSVPNEQTPKKRAATEELGDDDDEGLISDTKGKSRAKKKKTSKSGKSTEDEAGEKIIGLGYASDNAEEEAAAPTSTKKRKTPKITSGQKGNWSKEEDNIILHLKGQGKGWQEITDLVREAGSSESDRTLTAVRLRYQKVLKDRDVELTAEELGLLHQAKADIETTEKYRFIATRYKELSGGKELSKGLVKKALAPVKGDFSIVKSGGESTKV